VTKVDRILSMLALAPATNADIADELCTHSGDVARTMSVLVNRGVVVREIVPKQRVGGGRAAVYRLPPTQQGERE
jgi:predicted ArsR family transcriptional regulator